MGYKKIICVDFDGVLHSYSSGWKGPRTIPDPPVPGAMAWLYQMLTREGIEVAIYSSRCRYVGARSAMRAWLHEHFVAYLDASGESRSRAEHLLGLVKWPTRKPPAYLTIDDRAIQFEGYFPAPEWIESFKPWNRQ